MSGDDRDNPPGGRRSDGRPFKVGNTRDNGSYAVGRNRPPESGKFRAGDGRKRGKRRKGVRNTDTEFMSELSRKMTVREGGKERKVSKSQAVDLRLIDNATRKGDNKAIELVDARRRRIAADHETNRHFHTMTDTRILEAYALHPARQPLSLLNGCCQSNRNLSPIGAIRPRQVRYQAARLCHSVNAAERRALNVSLSTRWRSELKWL